MRSSPLRRVGIVVMVLAFGTGMGAPAAAQAPTTAPGANEQALDPIKCWWRTNTSAVQIGEQFTLALTCGVVETSRTTVVPDTQQLEPTTLQLAPFEIVGGVRHEDIQAPPWRYLQFEYTLRLIGDGFFGQDVDIPSINVKYNIQSPNGGETPGRDQLYALPVLPIRVLSLVPTNATDIRDVSRETFGDIEARWTRATRELVAAGIFFSFAGAILALGFARMVGRYRERVPVVEQPLPARAVLGGCLRRIKQVKSDVARDGWTPDLAGRALSVFRIAGAVALDRPVAQALVDRHVQGREGQLVLRKGILRPRRAMVSAPTTQDAITRQLGNGQAPDARTQAMLEQLRDCLHAFNAARYGRNGHLDATMLDTTLENGTSAIERLRIMKLWPMRMAARVTKSAAGLGGLWSRSENS